MLTGWPLLSVFKKSKLLTTCMVSQKTIFEFVHSFFNNFISFAFFIKTCQTHACRSQNSLCWSKLFLSDQNLFRYCARPKLFVPDQKMIFFVFMPCPYAGPKMFCAGPNFLSQPKNLTAFSASSKTFVQAQKPILLNANHLLVWHKMFVTGTICK